MGWFLAAAVLLLTAAIAYRTSSPRNALIIAGIAVLAIAGAVLAFLLGDPQGRVRSAGIAPEEIVLSNVVLTTDRYGRQLSGDITNSSEKRLKTLSLRLTFRDCEAGKPCRPAGEEVEQVFLALPAGQIGHFSVLVARAGLKLKGELQWNVDVVEAVPDF
ncbi:MAG: hypothetical protein JWL62_955 [Hyphomicrobiales bacterium]|nr:hypothetical protein [Hyphomicrobiales bacterium]